VKCTLSKRCVLRKPRQSNQKYKCAPMTKANITPMIAIAIGYSIFRRGLFSGL
jgi:hypothetical protein